MALLADPIAAQTVTKKAAEKDKDAGPGRPADYTSPHFLVHTDLSPAQAKELLVRLETMLGLISKYWGKPCSGIIECYVVQDINNWPDGAIDGNGLQSILNGAGVTQTRVQPLPNNRFAAKATVYAVADRGTPQHEAVHAYCGQTFGTTGPTWYAEGMAEMGQYWRAGELAVTADPIVVEYIRKSPPKSLLEIVDTKAVTGDSWQNYAWRWALCHLLANNPNYSKKFYPLGMGFLTKQDVSFEKTYGDQAEEISFEYLFFLKHMDIGYRVDLCAWDWNKKFKPTLTATPVSTTVDAQRGWQASGLTVSADQEYEYSVGGTWQTSKEGKPITADGEPESGIGQLMGVTMKDFKLGTPFKLGRYGNFKPPSDGNLYLRCEDKFIELADNKGKLTVKLKLKGKGDPLPEPKDSAK